MDKASAKSPRTTNTAANQIHGRIFFKSFHLPVLGSGSSSASCGQEVPTVSTQDLQCIAIGSLNFPDSLQAGMSPYILNTQEPTVHNPPKEYMAQQSYTCHSGLRGTRRISCSAGRTHVLLTVCSVYSPTMQACSVDRDTPQPSPTMHPCREEECSQYDCLRLRRRSQDSMQPSSASADLPSWPQECCSLLL